MANVVLINAFEVPEDKDAQLLQGWQVNLLAGFIVTIYEAYDADTLERDFERLGFPFDEMHEIQFATTHEGLAQIVASQGG